MDGDRPVYWYEGLFLRPQHFQQQDLYHQSQARLTARLREPFFWGVHDLTIQTSRLPSQVFEVGTGSVVLRDGTALRFPENARVAPRSFEAHWDSSGEPLSVYLGLRRLLSSHTNVAVDALQGNDAAASSKRLREPRFVSGDANEVVYDLYARDSKEEIAFLLHNAQLFFGREIATAVDFDLLKIAEIRRTGNEIRLVDEYVPPLISTAGSATLVKLLKDLREQILTRARELAMYKGEKRTEGAVMAGKEFDFVLALRTLNRCVPLLTHFTEGRMPPPWDIYGALRALVGELSTFSQRFDVLGAEADNAAEKGLPAYDHEAIGPCFRHVGRLVTQMLDELTAGPDHVVPLMFDGTYYAGDADDRVLSGPNSYYICLHTALPVEYVTGTIGTTAKIASRELLPLLIARALPGVNATYLPSPPTALPRRPGVHYFELDRKGDVWAALKDAHNIAVYMDSPPADLTMELMMVRGNAR